MQRVPGAESALHQNTLSAQISLSFCVGSANTLQTVLVFYGTNTSIRTYVSSKVACDNFSVINEDDDDDDYCLVYFTKSARARLSAKFHYTDRTRPDRVRGLVGDPRGLDGPGSMTKSGRAGLVESVLYRTGSRGTCWRWWRR